MWFIEGFHFRVWLCIKLHTFEDFDIPKFILRFLRPLKAYSGLSVSMLIMTPFLYVIWNLWNEVHFRGKIGVAYMMNLMESWVDDFVDCWFVPRLECWLPLDVGWLAVNGMPLWKRDMQPLLWLSLTIVRGRGSLIGFLLMHGGWFT